METRVGPTSARCCIDFEEGPIRPMCRCLEDRDRLRLATHARAGMNAAMADGPVHRLFADA